MNSPAKHSKKYKGECSKPYDKTIKNANQMDHFEDVPLPNKGRPYTISFAVPASVLEDTCLDETLRTHLIGQLARAAVISKIDEIVVYNDHCWKKYSKKTEKQAEMIEMMKTILEYQECPQYLRKRLCPMSEYLSNAGKLNPANALHHLKSNQWCPYREGVVVGRNGRSGSFVDIGLAVNVAVPHKTVPMGARCTVKLPDAARIMKSPVGELVSPAEPRTSIGLYWGYNVRVADSLSQVFTEASGEYDYIIGTSDKGDPIERVTIPKFTRAIIVFGGPDGLELSLKKDPLLTAEHPTDMYDAYVNCLTDQGSRTIRTEEAIPYSLAAIRPRLVAANNSN